jgi:hypothetical protein
MRCPNCGSEPYSASEQCASCGHSEFKPLSLIKSDSTVALQTLRIELGLNALWANGPFGDERRYWNNDWQFKLIPSNGTWTIQANPHADNKTIHNGVVLAENANLNDGDILAIGNVAVTVLKCEMTVRIG